MSSFFYLQLQQLMDSIITAALTAVRVPDDYSEDDSSSLIPSILSLTKKKREAKLVKRFPGIFYRQRARQMGSNKPIKQNPSNGKSSGGAVISYKQIQQVG